MNINIIKVQHLSNVNVSVEQSTPGEKQRTEEGKAEGKAEEKAEEKEGEKQEIQAAKQSEKAQTPIKSAPMEPRLNTTLKIVPPCTLSLLPSQQGVSGMPLSSEEDNTGHTSDDLHNVIVNNDVRITGDIITNHLSRITKGIHIENSEMRNTRIDNEGKINGDILSKNRSQIAITVHFE